MHCSYRILDQVHIGNSVRVTSDSSTVPFDNKPMTDVEIVDWNTLGFLLQHPSLPKPIWVKFEQLPLNAINLEMGKIKNPITFVQEIRPGGSMVLMRADLLDYYELLHDKKERESKKEYKLKDLVPGERVISSICKDGNVMVYLGTFSFATYCYGTGRSHDYYYNRTLRSIKKTHAFVDKIYDRAVFAYEKPNGEYSMQWYAVENKVIKSVFKCKDQGGAAIDEKFSDKDKNLDVVYTAAFKNYWKTPRECADLSRWNLSLLTGISVNLRDHSSQICILQNDRTDIRVHGADALRKSRHEGLSADNVFVSEEEIKENIWKLQ